MTKQKAICILGMHRSGTSAIARAINLLGGYVGREDELMPPQEDNPDGFWEHAAIYSFHERLLKFLSRSWDSVLPMPEEWWKKPEIGPYRKELTGLIKKEFSGQPVWLWKDPRACLLLPLWKDVLKELDIDVSYVLCIRNPLDVAASLKRRDHFSKAKSLTLWHLHYLSSCCWMDGCRRTVVHYDGFLENWEGSLRKIAAAVDFPWPQDDDRLRTAMADFLKISSRHSHSDLGLLMKDGDVAEAVVSLYRLLIDCVKKPDLLDSEELRASVSKFYSDYSAFFQRMYSREWGIIQTTEVLRIEQESRQKIDEKDAHIGHLNERLSDRQKHIDNLERILQEKQIHIENLAKQREENYRDWQAHTKNLESILQDKQTHIENLERQREENYRDWQAQLRALNEVIQNKEQENLQLKMAVDERNRQIELLEHPKGFREKMARIREISFPKEP